MNNQLIWANRGVRQQEMQLHMLILTAPFQRLGLALMS